MGAIVGGAGFGVGGSVGAGVAVGVSVRVAVGWGVEVAATTTDAAAGAVVAGAAIVRVGVSAGTDWAWPPADPDEVVVPHATSAKTTARTASRDWILMAPPSSTPSVLVIGQSEESKCDQYRMQQRSTERFGPSVCPVGWLERGELVARG